MKSNIVKFKHLQARKKAAEERTRISRLARDPIELAQYVNDCSRFLKSEHGRLESRRTSTARTIKDVSEMLDEIADALLAMGGAERIS